MPTADENQQARDWLHAQIKPNTAALQAALANVQADGYASGALALAAETDVGKALPAAAVGEAKTMSLKKYWDAWKPGDIGASELLDNGGFQVLLSDAGVTVKGIADTTLDRMGTLLAEGAARGDSVDEIARALRDVVSDPKRAYAIANTELNRATSQATADVFAENDIEEWDWLVSDGACPECEDQANSNPHSLGDEQPPLHPECRCAMSPRAGSYRARDDEEIPEDSDEG